MHLLAVKLRITIHTSLQDQKFAVEDDGLCALDSKEVGHRSEGVRVDVLQRAEAI